jgi:uncharacterized protein DUF3761
MRRLRTVLVVLALAATTCVGSAAPARAAVHPSAGTAATCKVGYYKNVDGHCVHRPTHAAKAPAGATAKCRDGTYSFSQHASGTCSHHGGVAVWINHP